MNGLLKLSQYFFYPIKDKQCRIVARECASAAYISSLIVLIIILSITTAHAGPIDDTSKGMESLQSGDTVGAMRWFRKAAEQGYAPAQQQLAAILDRSENNEEAFKWYQKAAEQKNAEGQYGLGMMYLTGDGIEKDESKGVQLIETAAQQGLTNAMISMFHFNEKGQYGLPVDQQQAVAWLERIAAKDNQWAMQLLASAYRNGEMGVLPDSEKAQFWESKLQQANR